MTTTGERSESMSRSGSTQTNVPSTPSVHEQYKELLKGGPIGGGDKLTRDTWRSWFITLDYWAITKNVKWIYDDSSSAKVRRSAADYDELELVNAGVIIKIAECLGAEDKELLSTLKKAHELYDELRLKYTDRSPAKYENPTREFHNYKLGNNESVEHAWTKLKTLSREIIAINDALRSTYTQKMAYSQLLASLPVQYDTIRDAQRQFSDHDYNLEDLFARLQEKESDLKDRKESAHWADSKSLSRKSLSRSRSGYRESRRLSSSSSDQSRRPRRQCVLCKSDKHTAGFCSYLSSAQGLVKELSKCKDRRHGSSSKKEDKHDDKHKDRKKDRYSSNYDKGPKSKISFNNKKHRKHKSYNVKSDSESSATSSSDD